MIDPLEFTLATRDFDRNLLPEGSRTLDTEAFQQAVITYFAEQFAPMAGSAVVSVGLETISVVWIPDDVSHEPQEYALSLLQQGRLGEAVPLLRILLLSDPDSTSLLYNLGMAESDMGDLQDAIYHLNRAMKYAPNEVNTLIALAVAQQRNGEMETALRNLERAAAQEPDNGYARRNLGAMLGGLGRLHEAEPHLREAVRLMPGDVTALFSLAQVLEQKEEDGLRQEADTLYQSVIAQASGPMVEKARQARTRIAQHSFRQAAPERMDAVMYCLGALQKFGRMTQPEVQTIAFEIATLGQSGLDINNPASRYRLHSLSGDFSGLHLMCLMYVGFKRLNPELDIGFDLAHEYRAAVEMLDQTDQSAQTDQDT